MKTTNMILAGAVALAALTLNAPLQAQVTNVITLTATSQSQQATTTNGTTITTAAPNKTSINTKMILGFLAQDEYAEGKYVTNTFPAGAQLVVINDNGCPIFQVLSSSNTFLVDVSDIIFVDQGRLGNDIFSGQRNGANGLAIKKFTDQRLLTFGFNDFYVHDTYGDVVGLTFYMNGLMTSTTTDTTPDSSKHYTESHTGKMANAAGEGVFQGQPFVITGTLNVSGKSTLTLP